MRLRGQAVKTSPFHGGNTGSIPVGVITWYLRRSSQAVRQWSATPVRTGSNPVCASKNPESFDFQGFCFALRSVWSGPIFFGNRKEICTGDYCATYLTEHDTYSERSVMMSWICIIWRVWILILLYAGRRWLSEIYRKPDSRKHVMI